MRLVYLLSLRHLHGSLLPGLVFAIADVRPSSHQFVPQNLALPLAELKNRTMNAPAAVNILEAESVVFLVGKKAHDSPSTIWSRSFSQCHRQAADLLALLAERNVLDRRYLELHGGFITRLKLQSTALHRQSPARIVFDAFETQEVSDASAEWWGQIRLLASLANSCDAAANEQDQTHQYPMRYQKASIRRVFPLNHCEIHVFSPSPTNPENPSSSGRL